MSCWSRHSEGGGAPWCRGERVEELCCQVLGDQRQDQFGIQTRSHQFGVFGAQRVEAHEALEPFEGKLDLPAQPVELEQLIGTGLRHRQRAQEHHVFGRLEPFLGGRLAVFGGLAPGPPAGFRRTFFADVADQQPGVQGPPPVGFPQRDQGGHVQALPRAQDLVQLAHVGGAAIGMATPATGQPATDQEVGAGRNHMGQLSRFGIVAIADKEVARRRREALQALRTVPVAQLKADEAARRQVVIGVQER